MKPIWTLASCGLVLAFLLTLALGSLNARAEPVFQDRFEPKPLVTVTATVRDFMTADPIAGVAVSALGEDYSTNAEGEVILQLEENTFPRVDMLAGAAYRNTLFYPTVQETVFSVGVSIPSRTTLSMWGSALGISPDSGKSIAMVSVLDSEDNPLVGALVQLNVSYGSAFAFDSSSPVGFSSGQTTLANSLPIIMFWNVDVGDVEPTVTADGYDCSLGPSSISSEAETFMLALFYCIDSNG